ncbi:hypothetical protein ACFB49_35470 [Sphingomonas sp. DBB INV C78]|uniref:hypothetical protein n=1 Tax=Sphingomonas sp. DBB INV C78 TaxID=3349434 RepID=UPI0036D38056
MAGFDQGKPPVWFWAVVVCALLWNLMGCLSYLREVTMTAADLAKLPVAQQELWKSMPGWLFGIFAIAVWVGLLGSIMLALRKRIARPLYIVSLVAAVAQFAWIFTMMPMFETVGPSGAIFPAIIILIGIFLVWFAGLAIRRGWVR